MTKRRVCIVVAALLLATQSAAWADQITITSVAGFPNGRTFNDLPQNAIDGDTTTYTWTTNPNNVASPSHLAVGFDSTDVNRLRLWKSAYGGGGNNSKNLTIQYTTDSGPLEGRAWITVTNLSNGFLGSELLQASAVSLDGTVTGDVHTSEVEGGAEVDGWASLTFDTVTATGLRISFSNPNPIHPICTGLTADQPCNHYRVGEFEAHFDGAAVLTVAIDIKPGGIPNSVNPRNRGVIPVAILTTSTFDASGVDASTVRFGTNLAAPVHSALEDVDGDADLDLILHFRTQATGIACGHTSAPLTGTTIGGQAFQGADAIMTVGCQ